MKYSKIQNKGFTLIELLVVIMIIVVLMGILVPVVNKGMAKAQKTKALNTCTQLVTAVDSYYNTYNILPANSKSAPTEDTEVDSTEPIMSVLVGINVDNMNRKEQSFFSGEEAKGSSKSSARGGLFRDSTSAELYDPWKKKASEQRGYLMLLDYGYDEKLDDPIRPGRVLGKRVVTWSTGKDGEWSRGKKNSKVNQDNVYSWMN
ncbi:MAG: prepilin-type N-terminal cleavage/methylation domain-containing protein [Verrucomicrobiota bacterium JB023]|nr:prepilin-type N-terminal cleavage/methylation domain-containing protein [Verrucomicrobiota bacterium JB023]